MPESTIADFVAQFVPDSTRQRKPTKGRVILSRKRLVLAASQGRVTIPLEDVFDVVVGQVPSGLSEFFDDTIVVAYRRGSDRATAVVEANTETVTRFRTVLFKALLQGTTVQVKHPVQIGGRRVDASVQRAELCLEEAAVRLEGIDQPLRIELSSVTYYRKTDRTVKGRVRPVLEVTFTRDGESVTSEIVVSSSRLMNLLSRYVRLEYSSLVAEIREVDLPETEVELLTAIYSGAGNGNLAKVLGMEPSSVTMLLNSLEKKQLLATTDEGTQLTSLGRMAVSDRVEDVNA